MGSSTLHTLQEPILLKPLGLLSNPECVRRSASQVCGKVDIYGVFPRCGKHTKARCRYTYWDETEPSTDERLMRNFEQKMLMAMHIAGHVNTNTPVRAPERGGSSCAPTPHPGSLVRASSQITGIGGSRPPTHTVCV
jgi:hypothetical protein